jgi:hypothetical protein
MLVVELTKSPKGGTLIMFYWFATIARIILPLRYRENRCFAAFCFPFGELIGPNS